MAQEKKYSQGLWLGLSIIAHLLFLACLFATIANKPTLVRQLDSKKLFTFKVPAPVIFYGQPMESDKRPGLISVPSFQENKPLQAQEKSLKKASVPEPESIEQELTKKINTAKSTLSPNKKNKQSTLVDIFNHARKTFSNTPHATDLQMPGDGAGQPIVIREGDIKYYSLWSTFLKHLNNAAQFNRVQHRVPVQEWIASKKITENLQCDITINKKGEIIDIAIRLSSGYKPFDEICIQDIWSASPFPPLPDQLGKSIAQFEVILYI